MSEIARGGMGVVYRARQSGLGRTVALKVMTAGALADFEQLARFKVEARAAANLQHPNIVSIHDIGEEDGQLFFTMALIEGPTLQRRIAEGPLPVAAAARMMSKLARAVHYAHRHGILHRDLKPANVLLDAEGEPHLTDFGLAKLAEREVTLTATHAVMGTPAYMSPEQARGDARALTTATDVYGLGAVLFECLAGRPPFSGQSALEVLSAVLDNDAPAPSTTNAAVDRDLETICLKCLDKDPAQRYASAEALADDLDRYLRHEAILARPSTRLQKLRKWVRRRPASAALAASLSVALLAGAVGVAYEWRRAQLEATRALRSAEALRQNLYVADMGLAYQSAESGNVALARELLEQHRPAAGAPDLRGFEWRRLYGSTRPRELFALRAKSEIWASALSPDGRHLAAASELGGVEVFDLETRERMASIESAPDVIYSIAFSPDGRTLAMPAGVSDRRAIRLWEPATGETTALLEGHEQDVFGLAFSLDGRYLASSGGFAYDTEVAGEILIWDLARGGRPRPLSGHSTSVGWLGFSPDGTLLASPHGSGEIRLWDPRSGRAVTALRGHRGLALCVAFSPDGRRLASGGVDGTVRLWDVPSGQLVAIVGTHEGAVYSVEFSPDGRTVASSGIDHTARVWDAEHGGQIDRLDGHQGRVFGASFTPDGGRLVTASTDGTARVWSASTQAASDVFDRHAGTYAAVSFSADGHWMVRSSFGENRITVWKDLVVAATLPGRYGAITPKGEFLIVVPIDGVGFEAWSLAGEAPAKVAASGEARLNRLVECSPDGRLVALLNPPGTLTLWEVGTWRQALAIEREPDLPAAQTFSRDGAWYALAHGADEVDVWRVSDGAPVVSIRPPSTALYQVAFSPDGRTLAVAHDTVVGLWEMPSGTFLGDLRGDAGLMWSVGWSADGKTLASGTQDGAVILWNATTLRRITALPAHNSIVCDLAFSPDDSLLATISVDHELRLLRAPSFAETD